MTDRIHPDAVTAFDRRAAALISDVVTVQRPGARSKEDFEPDRYRAGAITDSNIIGDVQVGGVDERGRESALFFFDGSSGRGLVEDGYRRLTALADQIQKQPSLQFVSQSFLVHAIFEWVRDRFLRPQRTPPSMWESVLPRCVAAVRRHRILVPIPDLYVEVPIHIGGHRIETVPASFLDYLDGRAKAADTPDAHDDWRQIAQEFREKLQGLAAVFVEVTAERKRAQEIAHDRAIAVTDALRLFSPAHIKPWMVSLWAPWGFEHRRSSWIISLKENDGLDTATESIVDFVTFSQLSARDIAAIREAGLDVLSSLLSKETPTEWEQRVIAAAAIFSRGALSTDTAIRLVHQFSALESLLLRSETEPIQQNLAERAAFYSRDTVEGRRQLVSLFRDTYAHRSAYVHHGKAVQDEERFTNFSSVATQLMWRIVRDAPRFASKEAFLSHIDQIKFS